MKKCAPCGPHAPPVPDLVLTCTDCGEGSWTSVPDAEPAAPAHPETESLAPTDTTTTSRRKRGNP